MAVGPWAQPLDCPIGSVAPQLLCTPGAQARRLPDPALWGEEG